MARDLIAPTVVLCRTFIARLPERVREQLRQVRLEVLHTPTPALVEDGVEPTEAGAYIQRGELEFDVMEGWWTDSGTIPSLLRANQLVAEQARKEGMLTMLEDGLYKAAKGTTSIEEVLRAVTE